MRAGRDLTMAELGDAMLRRRSVMRLRTLLMSSLGVLQSVS